MTYPGRSFGWLLFSLLFPLLVPLFWSIMETMGQPLEHRSEGCRDVQRMGMCVGAQFQRTDRNVRFSAERFDAR